MLILTRRVGESIRIGDDVNVTILSVKFNQVKIGIDAPKDIAVHREEIYQRIHTENQTLNPDKDKSATLSKIGYLRMGRR